VSRLSEAELSVAILTDLANARLVFRWAGAAARAEVYANVVISRVHHIDRSASIGQGLNGCRRRQSFQVPAKRQYDRVAGPSEAAIPNQFFPVDVVTLRIGIRLHQTNSVVCSGRQR